MKTFFQFLIAALIVLSPASVWAEQQAAMDPAVMEKMKTLMAPGEQHHALAPLAGNWTYAGQFWMAPNTPGQPMTGTARHDFIYGGRFLKQEIEGPWMGETFQGIGYTGYDNIKQQYVTVWLDSMATGLMNVSGQYDPETRTLRQSGTNSCPLTGEKNRESRSEWVITDDDHSTYTSYLKTPDGTEFKAMEIAYTRLPTP